MLDGAGRGEADLLVDVASTVDGAVVSGVLVSGGATAASATTVQTNDCCADSAPSLTLTVTWNVPASAGVPLIRPVLAASWSPDGSPLAAKVNVWPFASLACSCSADGLSGCRRLTARIRQHRRDVRRLNRPRERLLRGEGAVAHRRRDVICAGGRGRACDPSRAGCELQPGGQPARAVRQRLAIRVAAQ